MSLEDELRAEFGGSAATSAPEPTAVGSTDDLRAQLEAEFGGAQTPSGPDFGNVRAGGSYREEPGRHATAMGRLSTLLEMGAGGVGGLFTAATRVAERPERVLTGEASPLSLLRTPASMFAEELSAAGEERAPTRTGALAGLLPPVPLMPLIGQPLLGGLRGMLPGQSVARGIGEGLVSGAKQAGIRAGGGVLGLVDPALGLEATQAGTEEAGPTQGTLMATALGMRPEAGHALDLVAEMIGVAGAGKAAQRGARALKARQAGKLGISVEELRDLRAAGAPDGELVKIPKKVPLPPPTMEEAGASVLRSADYLKPGGGPNTRAEGGGWTHWAEDGAPVPQGPIVVPKRAEGLLTTADALRAEAETRAVDQWLARPTKPAPPAPNAPKLRGKALLKAAAEPGVVIPRTKGFGSAGFGDIGWEQTPRAKAIRQALVDAGVKSAEEAAASLTEGGYDPVRALSAARAMFPASLPEAAAGGGGARPPGGGGTVNQPSARRTGPPDPPPVDDPDVNALRDLIRQAKPVQRKTAGLYHAERSKRAGAMREALDNPQGEQTLEQLRSLASGELPKGAFEPVRQELQPGSATRLFDRIATHKGLGEFEVLKTQNALAKILDKDYMLAPQRGELAYLERVFGKELPQALLDNRDGWTKGKEIALRSINLPRELAASGDMSAPLRQGLLLTVGRPRQSWPAFKAMHKAFFSQEASDAIHANVRARPNAHLYEESGLFLAPDSRLAPLSALEEAFMSGYGERVPIYGRMVKASNRAYGAYLNKLRADVFDSVVAQWDAKDRPAATPKLKRLGLDTDGPIAARPMQEYEGLATYINSATGRGDLGALNRAAPLLNGTFFAPRLLKARIDIINPVYWAKLPKSVRIEAMKDVSKVVGAGVGLISLAEIARRSGVPGFQAVETDPRSAEFGKIRIGETRIDTWGGFQQLIRFLATFSLKSQKNAQGEIRALDGEGKNKTRLDVVGRFARSKLSPPMGAATDWMVGTTFEGDPFDAWSVAERVLPMWGKDMFDAVMSGDVASVVATAPGFYGVGTQTYTSGGPIAKLEVRRRKGEDVRADVVAGVKEGHWTWAQVAEMEKRIAGDEKFERFRKLSLGDLTATLKTLPPDEQAKYGPMIEMKKLSMSIGDLRKKKASGYATVFDLAELARAKARLKVMSLTAAGLEQDARLKVLSAQVEEPDEATNAKGPFIVPDDVMDQGY